MDKGSTSASGWTEAQIAEKLGISSAVYRDTRFGAREIAHIRKSGIANIEISRMSGPDRTFDYLDRKQVAEIKDECRKQGARIASFHLPHRPPLPLQAADEWARKEGDLISSSSRRKGRLQRSSTKVPHLERFGGWPS